MKRVDGWWTDYVWFNERVVLVTRRWAFVLSIKAFGKYNRLGTGYKGVWFYHVSRGG